MLGSKSREPRQVIQALPSFQSNKTQELIRCPLMNLTKGHRRGEQLIFSVGRSFCSLQYMSFGPLGLPFSPLSHYKSKKDCHFFLYITYPAMNSSYCCFNNQLIKKLGLRNKAILDLAEQRKKSWFKPERQWGSFQRNQTQAIKELSTSSLNNKHSLMPTCAHQSDQMLWTMNERNMIMST